MMKSHMMIVAVACLLLCGCSTPHEHNPTSKGEVEKRLKAIRLREFDHSQSSGLHALRELVALAKYADRPVHINIEDVEGVVAISTQRWLLERKPVRRPEVLTMLYTGWEPSEPRYGEWTTTIRLRNTNLCEAFDILCSTSGLEWSVDQWMGIRVRFADREANQLLQ